jgi:hypothetical protein
LVSGDRVQVIRERESADDQMRLEKPLS